MALRTLLLNDRFSFAFDEGSLRFMNPYFDAAYLAGPARPSVGELGGLLGCQRQISLGRLASYYLYRPRAALKAITDALHGVFSRRKILSRVAALRLADHHEGQALIGVEELHVGS